MNRVITPIDGLTHLPIYKATHRGYNPNKLSGVISPYLVGAHFVDASSLFACAEGLHIYQFIVTCTWDAERSQQKVRCPLQGSDSF